MYKKFSEMTQEEIKAFMQKVTQLHNACKIYGSPRLLQTGLWCVWDMKSITYSYTVYAATVVSNGSISYETIIHNNNNTDRNTLVRHENPVDGKVNIIEWQDDISAFHEVFDILPIEKRLAYRRIEECHQYS